MKSSFLHHCALAATLIVAASASAQQPTWYAGAWDARGFTWAPQHVWKGEKQPEHPSTIALRIEVTDSETGLPLAGTEVRLEGEWTDDDGLEQRTRLVAVAGKEGIAVFGLTWLNKFFQGNRPLTRAKDDIDKVQRVLVRKPGYAQNRGDLDFSQLSANTRLWSSLVGGTEGAKYFMLQTGEDYKNGPERSSAPFFFKKVLDEDYFKVFTPESFNGRLEIPTFHERLTIGPFIVLPLSFSLKPAAGTVVVRTVGRSGDTEVPRVPAPSEDVPNEGRRPADTLSGISGQKNKTPLVENGPLGSQPPRTSKSELERVPERSGGEARTKAEFVFERVNAESIRRLGLYSGTTGWIIMNLPGSSAWAKAGLRAGDVVETLDHRIVPSASELTGRFAGGASVQVGIWRQGRTRWERVNILVQP